MTSIYELFIVVLTLIGLIIFIWVLFQAVTQFKARNKGIDGINIISCKALGARERIFSFQYRQSEYLLYASPNVACIIDKFPHHEQNEGGQIKAQNTLELRE